MDTDLCRKEAQKAQMNFTAENAKSTKANMQHSTLN